jgi:hypothetical protein
MVRELGFTSLSPSRFGRCDSKQVEQFGRISFIPAESVGKFYTPQGVVYIADLQKTHFTSSMLETDFMIYVANLYSFDI